ncbi:tetratricopeptide repeat protein [Geobacter sp. OR-1]|uniref:tetratricopeptide repeat protein n=1 Tax=Geobacter sp. OR-1 TaxID=1266765 RepID=UPI000541E8B2|nr:tetratricopeptide repeat protein [Geobacter sp. OR-1]GAM09396.1 tetratricopeptide repeat protein [Geobacter sp. OR-1]
MIRTVHSPVRRHIAGILMLLSATAGCTISQLPPADREEVRQIVETARKEEERGAIGTSVKDLKIALTIDPGNSRAREELNRLVIKQGKEAEAHFIIGDSLRVSNPLKAQKELLAALRLRPDYPEAITALQELQLAKAEAKIQARLRKEAAAKAQGKRAPVDDDEDSYPDEYSLEVAMAAFEAGDYTTAIKEFQKMKAAYPNDPDIQAYLERSWYNSGIAHYNRKDYKKALTAFSKVRKGFERVDEYSLLCRQKMKPAKKKK